MTVAPKYALRTFLNNQEVSYVSRSRDVFWPRAGQEAAPPLSGYHPQIKAGDLFTSCAIEATDRDVIFMFGYTFDVVLRLLFPNQYGHLFAAGDDVSFYEGEVCVGVGKIIEVL